MVCVISRQTVYMASGEHSIKTIKMITKIADFSKKKKTKLHIRVFFSPVVYRVTVLQSCLMSYCCFFLCIKWTSYPAEMTKFLNTKVCTPAYFLKFFYDAQTIGRHAFVLFMYTLILLHFIFNEYISSFFFFK